LERRFSATPPAGHQTGGVHQEDGLKAHRIRIHQQGPASVMRYERVEVGAPGPGQVRLRHEAIGVNFIDTMFRDGTFAVALPYTPGSEGAGVVEAVGRGVGDFKIGDRVCYFYAQGAYSTARLIEANRLIRLPDDIDAIEAASFVAKGLTAWMAVRRLYRLRSDETVLIQGASGGVGALIARWARALGATVIAATGSPAKLAQVAQGADHVVLIDDPQFARRIRQIAPDGVDIVYDLVGGAAVAASVASLRDGGCVLTIGATSSRPAADPDTLADRGLQVVGDSTPQQVDGVTLAVASQELFEAYRKGVFGQIEVTRYRLAAAVQVHEDLAGRRVAGSAVLVP
jgi:NADPH2:quinone reductase